MKLWLSLALVFLSGSAVFAQSVATLRGTVTDSSGAVISGAKIKITLASTGAEREVTTDTSGAYEIAQLQPGRYTLEAAADGFQAVKRERLDLLVATSTSVDIVLNVLSVKQEVTVSAESAASGP